MSGQTPYNLNEGTLGSLAVMAGNKLQKMAKNKGKRAGTAAKAEARSVANEAAKRSAKAKKAANTRKINSIPKPGRISGSKGIDSRPSGLPTIKPVVLNRTQHFESAVGNAKDASSSKPTAPKKDTTQISIDPATAYND
jgi:hypothetical protein